MLLDSAGKKAQVIAGLRAHIARVAPARRLPDRVSVGIESLDHRLGGWPSSGISLIEGRPGSGRLGLVLPSLSQLTQAGQWVPVVDGAGWLHPPGLEGVDLSKLILIQPGARAGWAAVQLARCGAFPVVVLLDPPALGRGGRRLQHAAEHGRCAVLVLSESREPTMPLSAHVVLRADGLQIRRGARRPSAAVLRWRENEQDERSARRS